MPFLTILAVIGALLLLGLLGYLGFGSTQTSRSRHGRMKNTLMQYSRELPKEKPTPPVLDETPKYPKDELK